MIIFQLLQTQPEPVERPEQRQAQREDVTNFENWRPRPVPTPTPPYRPLFQQREQQLFRSSTTHPYSRPTLDSQQTTPSALIFNPPMVTIFLLI